MSVSSVAIQFTIVDALSKGVSAIKDRLHSLGGASKEVKQDFDRMAASFKYAAMAGLATRELYKGIKPAIGLAGDLQSEMLGVKAELMGAGKDANKLAEELKAVKTTAFAVQSWTPFDMASIAALEKELIKAGASVEDITGKTGAAAASAALAVYEKLDPVETGKALIGIATPFKITAAGYMDLADTISRAASASTVGAAEIAESAKYAAGPMASLGKSSKDLLALSAVMAQVGISGSMAGVALKEFFLEAAKNKAFRDAKGNLLPTIEIIERLKKTLKGKGEAEKTAILGKVFGERGMQAAIALLNEGKGSYEDIVAAMEAGISLQDKLNVSMQGFNLQLLSLKGTFKSTLADLFQPALPILTAIVAQTNEWVSALGRASLKNEGIGKTTTALSLSAVGIGAAATLGLGGAGVLYGRKVLKGVGGVKGLLSGIGSDAAGIAKGKAVEAATGVTPVFVTNWPLKWMEGEASPIDAFRRGPLTSGGVAGGLAKDVGGLRASLAGIAKGKAVEAATGVAPVFVTNWPVKWMGNESSPIDALRRGSLSSGGVAGDLAKDVGGLRASLAGNVGAAGLGTTIGLGALAAVGGYAVGTAISAALDKWVEDTTGKNEGLGGMLYDLFHGQGFFKTENKINIRIDKDGRVFQEGNKDTDITLDRGDFSYPLA